MNGESAAGRPPSTSRVEMTQIVLPGDANALGTAFGGKVMQWIDIAAAVAARRHCRGIAVTASIDSVQLLLPVRIGDVVVLNASVNRAWRTSMEVGVRVEREAGDGERMHAASAYLTFVALDEQRQPRVVPNVVPQSDDDRRRYQQAGQRREVRLRARTDSYGVRGGDQELMGRVLAEIVHEVGSPLAVIIPNLRFLQGEPAAANEQTAAALEQTLLAIDRLTRLRDDAADYANWLRGKLVLDSGAVSIPDLLRGIWTRIGPWSLDREIALDLPPVTLAVDGPRLQRVLGNLVEHAARHTPKRGRVVLRGSWAADVLRLEISDEGPALATRDLPAWFGGASASSDRAARSRDAGGLALRASGAILARMNADVLVAACDGGAPGVCVRIALPARTAGRG